MCLTCWLRSGFSHMNIDYLSFTWYLVAAESRIWKQSGVQDVRQDSELCRCLKTFEDLSESKCLRTCVQKYRLVSIHQHKNHYNLNCTRKFLNHTGSKPLRDSTFHFKNILDFESSKDKVYIIAQQVCEFFSVP